MSALAPFFEHLFATGDARLTGRPEMSDRREIEAILRDAFNDYRLEVAGPLIEFHPDSAIKAAHYTALACWFVVSRDEPPEKAAALLKPPDVAASASSHLSIDVTLRYTVTIHRRARAQNPEDVLTKSLVETLRRWPLTGVLADIGDEPQGDVSLAGHRGLELLYAERLAACFRPTWLPGPGRLRDTVEMVLGQQGKRWPPEDHIP